MLKFLGNSLKVLNGHTCIVSCLVVLSNGDLASGSEDKTVRIWNSKNGNTKILNGHTSVVYSLALLPDGNLASGSADNTIRIWNTNNTVIQTV
jgi:phospholipase A-2-activating protein